MNASEPYSSQPDRSKPWILYEDNHVIVAFKPAGYLSQADQSGKPDMLSWIKSDIKQRYDKPGDVFIGLVHRLDQPVSGLMVFARTSKAAGRLSAQVRAHTFGKYYLAVIRGQTEPMAGSMEDYLVKDRDINFVRICGPDQGQFAHLDYETIAHDTIHNMSLVQIVLGTGRSHQIRVQFSSRGWPLAGDRRYGPEGRAQQNVPFDLALMAQRLTFNHPTKNEPLDFAIEPPAGEPWLYFPKL